MPSFWRSKVRHIQWQTNRVEACYSECFQAVPAEIWVPEVWGKARSMIFSTQLEGLWYKLLGTHTLTNTNLPEASLINTYYKTIGMLITQRWPWLLANFVTSCFYPVLLFYFFLFLFLLLCTRSLFIFFSFLPPINPRWSLKSWQSEEDFFLRRFQPAFASACSIRLRLRLNLRWRLDA